MEKSLFSPHYQFLTRKLCELREAAKLTQRQLAKRLRRDQTMVARIERGQRRLDLIEFYWYCKALQVDPLAVFGAILKECRGLDRKHQRSK